MNLQMEKSDAVFSTTLWTIVSGLRDSNGDRHRALLEKLIWRYWPPVYGYLRRSGHERERASELTQAFFADVVVSRDLFDRADRSAGRLRSLILGSLKNYLKDVHRRAVTRGGEWRASLEDVQHVERGLSDGDDAESTFDRTWAVTVLNEAVRRCERHFAGSGKSGHWSVFEARVIRPASTGCQAPALHEIAAGAGFRSAADAAAAVQVVKKRLDALLREVVGETAVDEAGAKSEYDDLMGLLRR